MYICMYLCLCKGKGDSCASGSLNCCDICSRTRHHRVHRQWERLQIKISEVETGTNKNRIHVLSTSEVLDALKETCFPASRGLERLWDENMVQTKVVWPNRSTEHFIEHHTLNSFYSSRALNLFTDTHSSYSILLNISKPYRGVKKLKFCRL